MKIILLICLAHLSSLFCANAESYSLDNIVSIAKNVYSENDKDELYKRREILINAIKALSDDDMRKLYKDLAKRVDITSDDPFAGEHEETAIGVILSLTKDESLIFEILLKTPPSQVGHLKLGDFLKKIDTDVIAVVLGNSANLRRNGDKPR
jgi:hypothetical protein